MDEVGAEIGPVVPFVPPFGHDEPVVVTPVRQSAVEKPDVRVEEVRPADIDPIVSRRVGELPAELAAETAVYVAVERRCKPLVMT